MDQQNLTIISIFRDRQFVFPRYFNQIEKLDWPFGEVHVVAVENDSKDRTRSILDNWVYPFKHVIGERTNEKYYGSVVDPERFRILSNAVNLGLDYITYNIETDYVMFIENDIIYDASLTIELKKLVDKTDGIVAPMCWTRKDKIFYDIWAFRYEGEYEDDEWGSQKKEIHFRPRFKSWYEMYWTEEYKKILSAGTCLMFKKEVLCEGARLTHEEAIVGFCKSSQRSTYAAYKIHIYHPQ